MTVLIGCGAAGAIAGIFKAPLAGMLFAIEVLMLDMTMASLLPLMISASTAASLAYFLMGSAHHFDFQIDKAFNVANIPWYIVLGIFCGLFSFLFTKGNIYVEGRFKKINNTYLRVLIGGAMLGNFYFSFSPISLGRRVFVNRSNTHRHRGLTFLIIHFLWVLKTINLY